MDKNKELAKWALTRRKAEGISQEGVSDKIGKSQISKIEKGDFKEIPLETLYELASGLGTTIDEPLRKMGYLPADSVTVRGELGRVMGAIQELPTDWQSIIAELAFNLQRRYHKETKRGSG